MEPSARISCRRRALSACQAAGLRREAFPPCEILGLADREVNLDRLNRGNGGDRPAAGIDQRAYLQLGLSGDAIDGGNQPGKLEIDLCRFDRGLRGLDLRLGRFHRGHGRQVVLHGVVEILLAGGLFLCQGLVALDIKIRAALHCHGIGECGLRLCQLALGLVEGCLKRPRVDLEQKLTLFDERAFLIALPLQVPCNLRPDVGIDEPVEGADPFAENRNILLLDLNHLDIRRAPRGCAPETLVWPHAPTITPSTTRQRTPSTSDDKVAFRNTGHVDEKPRREDVSGIIF